MKFEELPLANPLQRAVRAVGYETPTPIQERSIPSLLEGKDLLGIAQTGTGKTAAFALPILQRLLDSGKFRSPKTCRCRLVNLQFRWKIASKRMRSSRRFRRLAFLVVWAMLRKSAT